MSIKIRKRRAKGASATQQPKKTTDDILEVGRGEYCVLTINRHDGSMVAHRFETRAQAEAQHRRNMAEDKPLVGCTEFN